MTVRYCHMIQVDKAIFQNSEYYYTVDITFYLLRNLK